MSHDPDDAPSLEHLIPLLLLAVLFFASPFVYWWAHSENLWYTPYLLWLLVIVLGSRLFRHRDRSES